MLAVIPVVMVSAACSSPATQERSQAGSTQAVPVVTTGPAAVTGREFVSKRYGFRVTLTEAWSGSDAHVAWDGQELRGLDSLDFANYTNPGPDRNLVVGAAPVAKNMRLATWREDMVRAAPPVCTHQPRSSDKTTLGGEPALAWTAICSDGFDVINLAALHGNRGYMLFVASKTANDNALDRRIFESIRRSFHFTG